ncbi:MAG TPA: amylo-alpha-1,6-glucosidase [Actinomycetota bacterium]|nr:amylo-alpha-1,6-glucosidase [Actinomycetota bacterium]
MADRPSMASRRRPGGDAGALSVPRVPAVPGLPAKVLAVKEAETFMYSDAHGDIDDRREAGMGLYRRDTRYLSHLRLRISGMDPVLLSSSAERAYVAHVDLTNPELPGEDGPVPQHTVSVRRIRVIEDRVFERIRLKNYNAAPVVVRLELAFAADFADIFEVRGLARATPGRPRAPEVDGRTIEFAYDGEDGVVRRTRIELGVAPAEVSVRGDLVRVTFDVRLGRNETKIVPVHIEPLEGDEQPAPVEFDLALNRQRRSYEEWERECTSIRTDNELFDQLLRRGVRDLRALYTRVDDGGVIAAGIPWYVAVFGRDTLITAHQMLMLNPRPARESLRVLASFQGTDVDDWRDEEPGKILHEIRRGELAASGQLPHTPYYGSVDATPWFLIVLAQYFRWTNDLGFVKEMLPAADAALRWIDEFGDLDGDGFVEYRSRSPQGLMNQGWKDSNDSVVHADGTPARPPIALAEVQAYVYLAKSRMAHVFAALGDGERSVRLHEEAATLRRRFNEAFWMEDERYFAGALDGDKRQVRTPVSNPGHGLYCDIIDPEKADGVAARLFQPDMFSGWGIRTMSKSAAAYNPMSYHNGTVWPHDNALIAAGLKRYGFVGPTNRVATAMFDVAAHADYLRLPELFCGFARRTPSPPVEYPLACSPQAWAAGAPFLLLQAMLGVSAVAADNLLTVNEPSLPPWLNRVEIRDLRVGESSLSLEFRRQGQTTGFSLLSKQGDVRVVMAE